MLLRPCLQLLLLYTSSYCMFVYMHSSSLPLTYLWCIENQYVSFTVWQICLPFYPPWHLQEFCWTGLPLDLRYFWWNIVYFNLLKGQFLFKACNTFKVICDESCYGLSTMNGTFNKITQVSLFTNKVSTLGQVAFTEVFPGCTRRAPRKLHQPIVSLFDSRSAEISGSGESHLTRYVVIVQESSKTAHNPKWS